MNFDSDWHATGVWNVQVACGEYEDGSVGKLAAWFTDQGYSYVSTSPAPDVIRFDVTK